MSVFDRAVEEIIRKAMEEGQFDNLPGRGKPLNLEENPYTDPGWATAYHVLKSNGYSLPWMEHRKELEAQLAELEEKVERYKANPSRAAAAVVKAEISSINRRIMDYNLKAPSPTFHMRALDSQKILRAPASGPGKETE